MDSELEKMAAGVKLDDDRSTGRKHERRRKKSKDLLDTTTQVPVLASALEVRVVLGRYTIYARSRKRFQFKA